TALTPGTRFLPQTRASLRRARLPNRRIRLSVSSTPRDPFSPRRALPDAPEAPALARRASDETSAIRRSFSPSRDHAYKKDPHGKSDAVIAFDAFTAMPPTARARASTTRSR